MKNYLINYQNGFTQNVEVQNLEEVKAEVLDGISYTGCSITIELDGEIVSRLNWYGIEPAEEDEVLVRFGDFGFYSNWIDE